MADSACCVASALLPHLHAGSSCPFRHEERLLTRPMGNGQWGGCIRLAKKAALGCAMMKATRPK